MNVVRLFSAFVLVLVFGVVGCATEPKTCEEAACNETTEMCVLAGSDTLAPNVARCEAIVDGCDNDRTCECLDQAIDDDSGLRFCFDAGGCTVESDGVLKLVCPGG